MINPLPSLLILSSAFLTLVDAQYPAELVGTWSTKSKAVRTGPDFYNPVEDRLIEPEHAGISYSFTQDGYYEEAYYRAIPNPTTPKCPSTMMQWQHGTYSLPGNGSLVLQPFEVDGRQVLSAPCSYDNSVYTRYSQPELIKSYQVLTDPYHNVQRLNLYKFDGSPMQPMYLIMNPPQMLPTQTLNPTETAVPQATGKAKRSEDTPEGLWKRMTEEREKPQHRHVVPPIIEHQFQNPDKWWWAGLGFIAVGTVMYMFPTTL